jgi:hypothetical protein
VHDPELAVVEKEVPEMHGVHVVAPEGENFPAGHPAQTVSAVEVHAAVLYFPAGHTAQALQLSELLLTEKVPAGHAGQVESEVWLHVDATYWPGVHTVHGVHTVCELDVHGVDA